MNNTPVLEVNNIITKPNKEYFLDKWGTKNHRILFITGLAGAGKTTLGDKLASEHNCPVFHMDYFCIDIINLILKSKKYKGTDPSFSDVFSENSFTKNERILFQLMRIFIETDMKAYITEVPNGGYYTLNGEAFGSIDRLRCDFLVWLVPYLKKTSYNKVVVEGIWLYTHDYIVKKYIVGEPLILVETSKLEAYLRAYKRSGSPGGRPMGAVSYFISSLFNTDMIQWYNTMVKEMNNFEKYIEQVNSLL